MSSFGGKDFSVKLADDGMCPLPTRDSEGIARLRVDIAVRGALTYTALQGYVSRGTPKPVTGTMVTNFHVSSGGAPHTLIVPWYRGVTKTYTAVLVDLALEAKLNSMNDPWFMGTAEFIILTAVL